MVRAISPYPAQLTAVELLSAADVTLGGVDGWWEIGAYPVPDGMGVELGQGKLAGQDQATGRLYFDIVDTVAAPLDGLIRIEARNPTQTRIKILWQGSTTKGRSANADDRTGQVPFPESGFIVQENWTIRTYMKPRVAGGVVDVSACTFLCDVLQYDLIQ
jgi:hypothetical protein